MKDYYQILGIDEKADISEIKRAYRQKAHQFHPDKNTDSTNDFFTELNEAYQTLSNPEKRKLYDDQRNYGDWMAVFHAYQQAYQQTQQAQQQQTQYRNYSASTARRKTKKDSNADYKETAKYYRIVSFCLFLFGLSIVVDAFLPEHSKTEIITSVNLNANAISTVNYSVQFDNADFFTDTPVGKAIEIKQTPIFRVVRAITISSERGLIRIKPGGTIYSHFSFFLLVFLFTSFIGAINDKRYKLVADMAIISIILFFIVLFLTLMK